MNGASMSYTYDDLDRLSTVVDNRLSVNNTTTYSYDSASNVATVTYPNGVQSTFTYDTLNRRVAPVSVIFSNQDEGAPGPLHLGTGDSSTTRSLRL